MGSIWVFGGVCKPSFASAQRRALKLSRSHRGRLIHPREYVLGTSGVGTNGQKNTKSHHSFLAPVCVCNGIVMRLGEIRLVSQRLASEQL